jgi:hypothetical protein
VSGDFALRPALKRAVHERQTPRNVRLIVNPRVGVSINQHAGARSTTRNRPLPNLTTAQFEQSGNRKHLLNTVRERGQGMADSLTTMGFPSAVLLGSGKVISTNSSFKQVGPQIISTAFGGIALANPEANTLLAKAIEGLSAVAFQNGAKSIAVPANGAGSPSLFISFPCAVQRMIFSVLQWPFWSSPRWARRRPFPTTC